MMFSRSPHLPLAVDAPDTVQTGGSVVHSQQFLGGSTNAIYNACRFGTSLASSIALAAEFDALAQLHVMRTQQDDVHRYIHVDSGYKERHAHRRESLTMIPRR
ncbi:hypothetical protein SCAR479_00275 [Seiridium cardinale]|uniref:Uncharacterized protein n=1 Tax=Seiridium cardinale TaxID=138064 RepID=A0ABR2Y912_9PEZI